MAIQRALRPCRASGCHRYASDFTEAPAMVYIMNQGHPAPPSVGYQDTIERGYSAVGFHPRYLAEGPKDAAAEGETWCRYIKKLGAADSL